MCRWLAYSGNPVYLADLVFETEHSLIEQSQAAEESPTPTNGDGFGVGWFGERERPGVFRDIQPAWNDANLRDLATQIRSPLFLAHVRATTGTEVQRTNCHPFRHGRWLFVHNGLIYDFARLRRDLAFEIRPDLYPHLLGTTDSELMFLLALTFGLEEEPVAAVERMVGLVEAVGRTHGVTPAVQMTLGLLDGERIWAFRYASEGRPRTLYHSKTPAAVERLNPSLQACGECATMIVSEPLTDMNEEWQKIPASSAVIAEGGELTLRPFRPRPPG